MVDVDAQPALLLTRLLQSVDEQASLHEPVNIDVVFAALTVPLVVDAINDHQADLKALISGEQQLQHKSAHPSSHKTDLPSAAKSRAFSHKLMQNSMDRWDKYRNYLKKTKKTAHQADFLNCLSSEAVDLVRSNMLEGLIPRANAVAVKQLLEGVWRSIPAEAEVSL